jgi:cytochrome c-type protein NapC
VLGDVVLGIVGVVAFDGVMHATSTDAFCTSCHEMDIPYAQVQTSTHYSSASGMRATCSDCHVPREFGPKMVRKIEAAREVWGSITGVIDTPEKYAAHAPAMKQREINCLLANDSRECRNCHESGRMLPTLQTAKARQYHQLMWGMRASNSAFTRGGCFAACHSDLPGMSRDRGQQQGKYLWSSRVQQQAIGQLPGRGLDGQDSPRPRSPDGTPGAFRTPATRSRLASHCTGPITRAVATGSRCPCQ